MYTNKIYRSIRFVVILFMHVLVISIIPINAFGSLKSVKIQLPWYLSVEWAGIIMAKEKGIDKKYGINLEIINYKAGTNPMDSTISGETDIGMIDAPSIIMGRIKGANIIAIWAQMQISPFVICTLKESNINTVSDLRGKKFGAAKEYEYLLDMILAKAKVPKKDIDILYIKGDPIIPLEQKQVAAVGCFDIYQPPILRIRGKNPYLLRSSDVGVNYYEQVLFTTKATLKNKPLVIQKTVNAIRDGWLYALNNIDGTVYTLVSKYRPFNPKEWLLKTKEEYIAHQKASLKLIHHYMTKGVGMKIGLMRRDRWQETINMLYDIGMTDKIIQAEDVHTTQFIKY